MSIVVLNNGEWKPHYQAKYSREQLETFARQPHPFVDSRCIMERFRSTGIEVVLADENPINGGRKVTIKQDGFYEQKGDKLELVDFTIWTISIPLTEKFAHVFKGMKDRESNKYRVWFH